MEAGPVCTGIHVGHTSIEVALRSKPEGREFPSLSRLVHCRKLPGQAADDAVLTLKILNFLTGETWLISGRSLGLGGWLSSRSGEAGHSLPDQSPGIQTTWPNPRSSSVATGCR
jgi:hypothetical protein